MSKIIAAAAIAGGLILALPAAAGVAIPVVPYPGATLTTAFGINDSNVIVGSYQNADKSEHGFFGTLDGQYTPFDFPEGQTLAYAISNDGTILGLSNVPSDDCPNLGCAYVRKPNGDMVRVKKHHGALQGFPAQVIANGKFVGEYWTFDQGVRVFGFLGRGTKYKSDITIPVETTRTRPRGYEKHGMVSGYFLQGDGSYDGFVLKNGDMTTVHFPDENATFTELESISPQGQIVGGWGNSDGSVGQAFFYDLGKDAFDIIEIPGAPVAFARSINRAGLITVYGGGSSFVYCSRKKTCPSSPAAIEVPDHWVKAAHDRTLRPCSKACKPANIGEALAQDAALRIEFRRAGR